MNCLESTEYDLPSKPRNHQVSSQEDCLYQDCHQINSEPTETQELKRINQYETIVADLVGFESTVTFNSWCFFLFVYFPFPPKLNSMGRTFIYFYVPSILKCITHTKKKTFTIFMVISQATKVKPSINLLIYL